MTHFDSPSGIMSFYRFVFNINHKSFGQNTSDINSTYLKIFYLFFLNIFEYIYFLNEIKLRNRINLGVCLCIFRLGSPPSPLAALEHKLLQRATKRKHEERRETPHFRYICIRLNIENCKLVEATAAAAAAVAKQHIHRMNCECDIDAYDFWYSTVPSRHRTHMPPIQVY